MTLRKLVAGKVAGAYHITDPVTEAELMGIRAIDHIVVGSKGCTSFAEQGYL